MQEAKRLDKALTTKSRDRVELQLEFVQLTLDALALRSQIHAEAAACSAARRSAPASKVCSKCGTHVDDWDIAVESAKAKRTKAGARVRELLFVHATEKLLQWGRVGRKQRLCPCCLSP